MITLELTIEANNNTCDECRYKLGDICELMEVISWDGHLKSMEHKYYDQAKGKEYYRHPLCIKMEVKKSK